MPFMLDRDDHDYIKMSETFIRDRIEGYKRPLSILSDCLLSPSCDSLPLLTWGGISWQEARYEAKYPSGAEEAYFLGWNNHEFFKVPREERVKLYAKVRSRCGRKY